MAKKLSAKARANLEKRLELVSKNCLRGQPVPEVLRLLWDAKLNTPRIAMKCVFPLHFSGLKLVDRYDKNFFEGYEDDTPTCRAHRRMFDEIAFVGKDEEHGLVGFWLYKPKLPVERAPIVLLDSEGQYRVVAANFADYFIQAPWDNNHAKIRYTRDWFKERGIKARATEKAVWKAIEKFPDPNERCWEFAREEE